MPSAIPGAAFDTTGREAAVAAATPAEQPRLRRLYGVTTEALWLDAEGAPGPKAATALQLLESASDAGWIPATTA